MFRQGLQKNRNLPEPVRESGPCAGRRRGERNVKDMLCSTVRQILVNTEKKYGPEDAIRYKISKNEIESKTYTQLREDSESFSNVLKDLGEQGNHIAVIGMTSYEWLVTYFGTVNSGSVVVPLDVNLPAEDVCDLIARSDSAMLVYDEVRKDVAAIAKERCPQLKYLVSMQQKETDDHAYAFRKLLEEHRGGFDYEPEPDQLCTIMFTSGTTGKSKGVMLTHRNVAENATCLDMKIPERTVIMTVLPIHHAYCLSMDILKGTSLGAVICINDSLIRVAKNIKLFKPEMILMVPLMIETMAKKLEEAALLPAKIVKNQVFGKQFHTICSGGAYLDPKYIDMFRKYDIVIHYGHSNKNYFIFGNVKTDKLPISNIVISHGCNSLQLYYQKKQLVNAFCGFSYYCDGQTPANGSNRIIIYLLMKLNSLVV